MATILIIRSYATRIIEALPHGVVGVDLVAGRSSCSGVDMRVPPILAVVGLDHDWRGRSFGAYLQHWNSSKSLYPKHTTAHVVFEVNRLSKQIALAIKFVIQLFNHSVLLAPQLFIQMRWQTMGTFSVMIIAALEDSERPFGLFLFNWI